jgi:hypothetical protein
MFSFLDMNCKIVDMRQPGVRIKGGEGDRELYSTFSPIMRRREA